MPRMQHRIQLLNRCYLLNKIKSVNLLLQIKFEAYTLSEGNEHVFPTTERKGGRNGHV